MDNRNEYIEQETAQQEIPEAPTYTTATKPDPATKVRTVKRRRFSTAARVCMWIVGVIAGLTVIFTCVLVWIAGLQFLGVVDAPEEEKNTAANETYNFFVYDDSFADMLPDSGENLPDFDSDEFEDYFDGFNGGENSGEGEAAEPQSGTPGLGITIVALELQFAIDDKYTAGLVIDTIEDYSSFAGTKVQVNDMIVAAEGQPTPTAEALKAQFEGKSVGDDFTVTIARYTGGVATVFDITVQLIEMQN